MRKLLDERIPDGGSDADTRFSDEDIDELLTDATNIYEAAAAGWTIKAGMFQRELGQIESYALTADASLVVAGLVDLPPATPENFEVRMANGQPLLGWDPVLDTDLAGYNVYRTNRDGRFVLLAQVGNDTCVYHDREVKIADYAQSRLGYAVSSYVQGGNNSLWTPTLYWPFDEE